MRSLVRGDGRLRSIVLITALSIWDLSAGSSKALGPGDASSGICPGCQKPLKGHKHYGPTGGTLGYGPPGVFPGFQGFGLGYHPGYGYGGHALGPGSDGGYPFYGGPGYPHPWPRLRRCGGINPFPYFGGPGGPTPDCPNYFGGVGPLQANEPVVTFEPDPRDPPYAGDYGGFNGMVPYPESTFAPFVTIAADRGVPGAPGATTAPGTPPTPSLTPGGPTEGDTARGLGIGAEPAAGPGAEKGLKLTRVDPGSPAEKAGLQVGDIIRSANGYETESLSNLDWIRANAAPDHTLKMSVHSVSSGVVREVTIAIP